MTSVVKLVPRSELTLKGSPNLEKMWFINRQAVISAVSLGAGRHSIHFVNLQTTEKKYLLPRVDCYRGPTQSIWRSDNGKVIPFLCSGAWWKEAGVCAPVACWRRITAATEGLCGKA